MRRAREMYDERSPVKKFMDFAAGAPEPGIEPEFGPIDKPPPDEAAERIGICCSGGGIRSASFNLGALQVLQKEGILYRARYLSAVSGGSYIASSLAIVKAHSAKKLFGGKYPDPYAPGSPEEQHLRNNSSYIAPGLTGKLRALLRLILATTVNLIFIGLPLYIAGRLMGWSYATRSDPVLKVPSKQEPFDAGSGLPTEPWMWILAAALLIGLPLLQGGVTFLRRSGDPEQQKWRESSAIRGVILGVLGLGILAAAWKVIPRVIDFLLPVIQEVVDRVDSLLLDASWLQLGEVHPRLRAAIVFAAVGLVLYSIDLIRDVPDWLRRSLEVWGVRFLLLGAASLVYLIVIPNAIGFVRATLVEATPEVVKEVAQAESAPIEEKDEVDCQGTDARTTRECQSEGSGLLRFVNLASILGALGGALRALIARERSRVALLAGAVVGPLAVLAGFLWFVNDASARGLVKNEAGGFAVALLILVLGIYLADLTQWSLHPYYRRRLSKAFALQRIKRLDDTGRVVLGSRELSYDERVPISKTLEKWTPEGNWPELTICCAANISGEGQTPPGRNAATFTFSSDEVGGPYIGAIATERYEKAVGPRARDLTVPAAVAMSGAAVSPSMGKKTIGPLVFLMALFNIRLGVWVPNPRLADKLGKYKAWLSPKDIVRGDAIPLRPRLQYLYKELLGRNKAKDKYLYITDGGHYENLGLVELLRRGCTTIFCIDASGDKVGEYDTFGEAVSLARSELGVEINIEPEEMALDDEGLWSKNDHVIGTYEYPPKPGETKPAATGTLVWIKSSVTEDAPEDVKAFRLKDRKFPNHPTFDQLFNDQKFESYRALGGHSTRRAVHKWMTTTEWTPRPPRQESTDEELEFPKALRDGARRLLIKIAAHRQVITYSDMVAALNEEQLLTDNVSRLTGLLDEVVRLQDDADEPLLGSIVVDDTTFEPGEHFFQTAQACGWDTSNRREFLRLEHDRTFRAYATASVA